MAGCCACAQSLSAFPVEELPKRRKVADLVVRRTVTGIAPSGACAPAGRSIAAHGPPVSRCRCSTGLGWRPLRVYLTHDQPLPYQRTADLLEALAGIALSPATIYAMGCEAAVRLSAPVAAISQALLEHAGAHADETGMRVAGAL